MPQNTSPNMATPLSKNGKSNATQTHLRTLVPSTLFPSEHEILAFPCWPRGTQLSLPPPVSLPRVKDTLDPKLTIMRPGQNQMYLPEPGESWDGRFNEKTAPPPLPKRGWEEEQHIADNSDSEEFLIFELEDVGDDRSDNGTGKHNVYVDPNLSRRKITKVGTEGFTVGTGEPSRLVAKLDAKVVLVGPKQGAALAFARLVLPDLLRDG